MIKIRKIKLSLVKVIANKNGQSYYYQEQKFYKILKKHSVVLVFALVIKSIYFQILTKVPACT